MIRRSTLPQGRRGVRRGLVLRRPAGMATLEVVMVLGAMFPLAFLLFRLIGEGLRMYHAHVANVVGSPLM